MTKDWRSLYSRGTGPDCDDGLEYTAVAIDHARHPRNLGRVDEYHGKGRLGDPSEGEYLEITLCIDDEDRIAGIGLLVEGCDGAICTASVVTDLAKGRTIQDAANLKPSDVIDALQGLPEEKRHCALKSVYALRLALCDALQGREMIRAGRMSGFDEYRRLRRNGSIQLTAGGISQEEE